MSSTTCSPRTINVHVTATSPKHFCQPALLVLENSLLSETLVVHMRCAIVLNYNLNWHTEYVRIYNSIWKSTSSTRSGSPQYTVYLSLHFSFYQKFVYMPTLTGLLWGKSNGFASSWLSRKHNCTPGGCFREHRSVWGIILTLLQWLQPLITKIIVPHQNTIDYCFRICMYTTYL